jgi:hypothetical protein
MQNVERRPLAGLRLFSCAIKCALRCFSSRLRCDDLGPCGLQASSVGVHESHQLAARGVHVKPSLSDDLLRLAQACERLSSRIERDGELAKHLIAYRAVLALSM